MADEFSYCIQFHDENGEQFYLKSLINEQKNTISIDLSNLKQSWTGTRKSFISHILTYFLLSSQRTTSTKISKEVPIRNQ